MSLHVVMKVFDKVIPIMKELFGDDIKMASSQENDWTRQEFKLDDWKQTDAIAQQHTEALADRVGLKYSGYLPFTDPRKLKHEIKGHMVRPHEVHVAMRICFTLGGGEQIYNLGNYQISADWVHKAPKKLVEQVIMPQVKFYEKIAKKSGVKGKIPFVYETDGVLDEKVALKNKKIIEKLGIVFVEPEVEEDKK